MATVYGIAALAVALQIISAVMASTTEPPPPPQAVARCSSVVRECWASGGLWANASCHAPLEQGPCADTHWLVLDANALPRGKCEPRPCLPRQLPSKGRCLEEAEAREMCWSGAVHLDAREALRCGASPGWSAILEAHVRCEPLQQPTTNDGYYNRTDGGYYNYTDGGYYNYTDDGYYNHTDGGYYDDTDVGYYDTDLGYYKHIDGSYYNHTDGGYYNHTDGGYYNHTDGGYYNNTDHGYDYNVTYEYNSINKSDYISTGAYASSLDYLTDFYPHTSPKSMHNTTLATTGDRQSIVVDAPGGIAIGIGSTLSHRSGSKRISSFSALSIVAGALCALLCTRVARC